MSRGTFIVIEALDGVGKTTLVQGLAAALGGVALDTPGAALRPLRGAVLDALGSDQLARCLFYAASVLSEGSRARALADAGAVVVMDRYWHSTISYARARGVSVDLAAIATVVPRPDVTVLLTLDEGERVRRLAARGNMTVADTETLDERFRAVVMDELRRAASLEVDVTGADPGAVVRRVVTALSARWGGP